jgi:hypothetical protein
MDDKAEHDPKAIKDLGGRRKLADRRRRTSTDHFPERRWLRHRRSGTDRRSLPFFAGRKRLERRRAFQAKYCVEVETSEA